MARLFTRASSEDIVTGIGNLAFTFGATTIAAIVRPTVVNVQQRVFTAGTTGATKYGIEIRTSAVLRIFGANANQDGSTALSAGLWYLIAASKAAGAGVTPRLHIYDYAANTWVHENGAGTLNDAASPAATQATIGSDNGATYFDGDLAVLGVWNAGLSDAQIENLAFSLGPWFAASARPSGLWILDQSAVGQKVPDLSGGGADESVRTGTAVSTGSVPIWTPKAGLGIMAVGKHQTPQVVAIGQASETDTAQAMTRRKTRTLGQATETDLAQSLGVRPLKMGKASETDLAQTMTPRHTKIIGQAVETDTAQAMRYSKSKVIGQAVEVDSTGALTYLAPTPRRMARVSFAALAKFRAQVAWEQAPGGLFTLGTSHLGGTDVLAASAWSTSFDGDLDDITDDLADDAFDCIRGRTDDLAMMAAGSITLNLVDPDGKYDPRNTNSPLDGLLKPLRPLRLDAQLDLRSCMLSDSPVAYWRLNEPAGQAQALDLVAHQPATHGTSVQLGQAALAVDDATAASALYNGTSGAVSYVATRDLGGVFDSTDPWTITAWYFAPFLDANQRSLFHLADSSGGGAYLRATATQVIAGRRDSGGIADQAVASLAASGNVVHVVATYDGATIRLYVNGALAASQASTRSLPIASTGSIGNDASPSAAAAMIGNLADLAVYDYDLDAETIQAHYDAGIGTRFPVFYGFTRRIEHEPQGRGGHSQITAVDLFQRLSRTKPVITATGATTVGSVWGRLLDSIDWTDAAMRDLDVGDSLATFVADGSLDIVELGARLLDIDRGTFYLAASGIARYLDRNARSAMSISSVITESLKALATGVDLDNMINRQRVLRTGGFEQLAEDTTSIHAYGESEGDPIESAWLTNDAKALSIAQWIVNLRKDPSSDVWTLQLVNLNSKTLRAQLARELIDRVLVVNASTGASSDYHIEQIGHQASMGGRLLSTTWRLSERGADLFTLGTSVLGGAHVLG